MPERTNASERKHAPFTPSRKVHVACPYAQADTCKHSGFHAVIDTLYVNGI